MDTTQKLNRIRKGCKPRLLDLFSGCGGISLGFHAEDFEVIGAVECDPTAIKSHANNFHRNSSSAIFEEHAKPRDIITTDPENLVQDFRLTDSVSSVVDIIVGGPPCQAFARVGRAKLREVAEHPEAFLKDPRSNLYIRYLDYIKKFKPAALLMENVPDILNYGGHNIAEEICEILEVIGYSVRYTMLNAVNYGVPEMRERMFLIAFRKELGATVWFPKPTHWVELPKGYLGTRQVAMQTIKSTLFEPNRYFENISQPDSEQCLPAVTAEEALSDMPKIDEDSEFKKRKGPRRFNILTKYSEDHHLTDYQKMMRSWPGFEAREGIFDHVIRYLPRDYKIFERMAAGDQYPEAYKLALKMFKERLNEIETLSGVRLREGSEEYKQEMSEYVPPYDPSKFPNKWRKMEPDKPARTLMAHLGKDGYSHIHYDSHQARTISVREAARLQSFPDGFSFEGPMNPAFRQIGNAVPPLMARALAKSILQQLRGS